MCEFRDLAPPNAESDSRIKSIYQLPESERTFSLSFASSSQRSSSDITSQSSRGLRSR
ncbi:hypothetical protein Hanom_Chr07g00641251 [Helianthus anomalus]